MDLNELQSARDRERQTDKLQQLRESFYADAGAFIGQLRTERERAVERADDPFASPDVRQLTDEIETAEQTVEAIYENRVGKLVKTASFAAADMPAETDGMTAEEQSLFDHLVDDIRHSRERVLALLDGNDPDSVSPEEPTNTPGGSADTPDRSTDTPNEPREASRGDGPEPPADVPPHEQRGEDSQPARTTEVTAADAMGAPAPVEERSRTEVPPASGPTGHQRPPPEEPPLRKDGGRDTDAGPGTNTDEPAGTPPSEAAGPTQSGTGRPDRGADEAASAVERQRVQVLEEVETFLAVDERDYDLEPDDVVSLPATNAEILLEQGVAREL